MISREQEQIINAPLTEKTVVMACAAAGKTFCVTERIRHILKQGVDPNKIVALTFTNNAAAEMRERLGDDYRTGMFIGTMHSYANSLLTEKGIDTSTIREEEEFDKLFDLVEMNPLVIKEVDYLICDESQDLDEQQFAFVTNYLDPKGCLIVGDIRQSIYGFRGANPKCLQFLLMQDDFTVRILSENYRNGTAILKFSERFLVHMRLPFDSKVTPKVEIAGSVVRNSTDTLKRIIKSKDDYGDWAILCRTNRQVSEIMSNLAYAHIPCTTFRQAAGSLDVLKNKMKENTVKVLTIHSAKGLEFNNVIVFNQRVRGGDKQEELRLQYVAATRAKKLLYWYD